MFSNTQGTLNNVPELIREFYYEENRREPTGKQVQETFVFRDDNDVEQVGIQVVDELSEVTYLLEKPRRDLKTWDFVEQVKLTGGYDFVRYCLEKACEAERWLFHDDYLEWLQKEPNEADERYLDSNSDLLSFDLEQWQLLEPRNFATQLADVLIDWHQSLAKTYRDHLVERDIDLHGVQWQVNKFGRDNMNEAISYAERNNLPDSTKRQWILSDNTIRETSIDELKAVLNAYAERLNAVFTKYSVWRETDKLLPFYFE
ncbi:hypothetical protein [Vibrio furnissii]|uniref:DUF4376 domain-containing protein n=1 Tax=Vibrio furnissii TaxID=29494 RepID=UPI001EEC01B1|nr:hypothetical protein [Vibrio furnissii]MCG6233119.1 hypothetical protein [Vibrio furnissii]MCG6258927.1 hypothetical protein [Vibrio furnissii]